MERFGSLVIFLVEETSEQKKGPGLPRSRRSPYTEAQENAALKLWRPVG